MCCRLTPFACFSSCFKDVIANEIKWDRLIETNNTLKRLKGHLFCI